MNSVHLKRSPIKSVCNRVNLNIHVENLHFEAKYNTKMTKKELKLREFFKFNVEFKVLRFCLSSYIRKLFFLPQNRSIGQPVPFHGNAVRV